MDTDNDKAKRRIAEFKTPVEAMTLAVWHLRRCARTIELLDSSENPVAAVGADMMADHLEDLVKQITAEEDVFSPPPLAACNFCHHKSWSYEDSMRPCGRRLPTGKECPGIFILL